MESLDINTINELRKGNQKAFNLVVDKYYKNIWLYFFKKTNSHEIADELTNDTFNRLWDYRRKIDADQGVEAYLRQIAYGIFHNWLKKYEREKKQMAEYSADHLKNEPATDGEDALHARMDLATVVDRLTNVLPEKRCQIFLMSRMHGMSYEEIAHELAISKATVRDHLVKAKKTMSELGGFWKFP
ncbi:RNA polymerase sigma factor [Sphingobacterium lactis]|uniref:RNA polymerase sigma factor n=1 Tax=Sphingobacterium TaxID=28453 RepID=UPI002579C29D|nr:MULTISPECIES: sigma-70 family RNA polymerase sigma factor [Sphingobacterium]